MKQLRNWIEEALNKRLAGQPTCVGEVHGRKLYAIDFEDGTEADYFIDYDKRELELYREELCAEWIDYRGDWRLYQREYPQQSVAYVDDLEEPRSRGYNVIVTHGKEGGT